MATSTNAKRSSVPQTVLAVLVIVGIIAGVTYMRLYSEAPVDSPLPKDPTKKEPILTTAAPLTIPVTVATWDIPSEAEAELNTIGHYDFWFRNENDVPVDLGMMDKTCKCTGLTVCVMTPEEAERYRTCALTSTASQNLPAKLAPDFAYRRWALASAASEIGVVNQGLLGLIIQLELDDAVTPGLRGADVTWVPIPVDANVKGVTVPPHSVGIIRVGWNGKTNEGPERLKVHLWTQPQLAGPNRPREYPNLEVPLHFVAPIRVSGGASNPIDLSYREEKSTKIICWSSTRAGFALTAEEGTKHPCFTCRCVPLSEEERQIVIGMGTRVLYGYRVLVTVKERLSDDVQMDLGPFTRYVVLSSPGLSDSMVPIVGIVRGEVMVGAESDKGKINLTSFAASTGMSKTVPIIAEKPGVELSTDAKDVKVEPDSLDYLQVKLEKQRARNADQKGRWNLTVKVPRGGPVGALPQHSAILLKMPGSQRNIRVPISGTAYQK